MPRVIYLDALMLVAALSFMMDYLLLWATARAARLRARPARLAAAAAIGTAYFVAFYLAGRSLIPHYGWLRYWPVILGVSFGMLGVAFAPLPPRTFARAAGLFYFIATSSGGAGMAAGYALGWGAAGQLLFAIAAILITAELGWGVVQKSIWQRVYYVPCDIELFGERVRVTGLLDTGNQLKDPVTGAKVIVVEHQAIAPLVPEHLREGLVELERGDLSKVGRLLASDRWSSRFRVIPFVSLGRKNGLLVGFRPDKAAVVIEGRTVVLSDVVVGIAPDRLDPEGGFQALIHPQLVHEAAGGVIRPARPAIRTPKGESPHAATPS